MLVIRNSTRAQTRTLNHKSMIKEGYRKRHHKTRALVQTFLITRSQCNNDSQPSLKVNTSEIENCLLIGYKP